MSRIGLKFSQMILHTSTSKMMNNLPFLLVVLHKPTLWPSTLMLNSHPWIWMTVHHESEMIMLSSPYISFISFWIFFFRDLGLNLGFQMVGIKSQHTFSPHSLVPNSKMGTTIKPSWFYRTFFVSFSPNFITEQKWELCCSVCLPSSLWRKMLYIHNLDDFWHTHTHTHTCDGVNPRWSHSPTEGDAYDRYHKCK